MGSFRISYQKYIYQYLISISDSYTHVMNRIALARTLPRAGTVIRAMSEAAHPNNQPANAIVSRRNRSDILSPFSLNQMMREMDSLMPSFFGPPEVSAAKLAVDIEETPLAFIIRADVPGMTADSVKVELSPDNVLSIDAERSHEIKEGGEPGSTMYRVERRYGSMHRSFAVPDHVDVDAITADVKDGVLSLNLPKLEKATAHATRSIPVSGGSS